MILLDLAKRLVWRFIKA